MASSCDQVEKERNIPGSETEIYQKVKQKQKVVGEFEFLSISFHKPTVFN